MTMAAITASYYGGRQFYVLNEGWVWNMLEAAFWGTIVGLLISFLFGCHTPGVATGRRESHDTLCNVCIGRCCKAKEKERYDTYYGYHEYHNRLVDGKGESEQSLIVNDRQIEYDVLGLYTKNDVEAIKKSTNLAQVDNLRLHETVNTHTFFINGPNHHFKSSHRNNQPVVSNEQTRIIKNLKDMLNKHLNQAYARIAALKSFDEKGHGLYDATGRHMQGAYATIDQNGNVGMSNDPNNKMAGSNTPPDVGRIRTASVSAADEVDVVSGGTAGAGETKEAEIEMQTMEQPPPERPPKWM